MAAQFAFEPAEETIQIGWLAFRYQKNASIPQIPDEARHRKTRRHTSGRVTKANPLNVAFIIYLAPLGAL